MIDQDGTIQESTLPVQITDNDCKHVNFYRIAFLGLLSKNFCRKVASCMLRLESLRNKLSCSPSLLGVKFRTNFVRIT